ncbi:uncharacterized protein [Temnothorax longispinosus]|uniref:uncharacterized protein n=1 Tax=Temnothorax longispinosus TaxID=300112 RepID=UPI003A99AEC1
MKVYSSPTLALPCILGVDFLKTFGINVNFVSGTWSFVEDPSQQYHFDKGSSSSLASVRVILSEGESVNLESDPSEKGKKARKPEASPLVCCGLSELTPDQEKRLREFLKSEITGSPEKLGATTLTEHRIEVGDHPPIKQRCYPVSPKIKEAIYDEVDRLLEAGIIEPFQSEWSTPIVMIKKPNGTYRFCLDFRLVNNISKKYAYLRCCRT